jgi:hypothetical protein
VLVEAMLKTKLSTIKRFIVSTPFPGHEVIPFGSRKGAVRQ